MLDFVKNTPPFYHATILPHQPVPLKRAGVLDKQTVLLFPAYLARVLIPENVPSLLA